MTQAYLRARYYDPASGRFTQEDPAKDGLNWYVYCSNNPVMFVDPLGLFDYNTRLSYSQTYNEDVEVLQNELVWLGYMERPADDDWGYFGPKTQAAVNAYKNDAGLGNTGQDEGVVGLQTWMSLGLIYRTQEDIDAGVVIVMGRNIGVGGRTQYKDVSVPINNALVNASDDFEDHAWNFEWFKEKVDNTMDWDIKLKEPWERTIKSTYPGSISTSVVLFGELTSPEALGNITYGYLGKACGFWDWIVLAGGDYAAGGTGAINRIKGVVTRADSEEDKANIRMGIEWYKNR